MVFVLWSFCQKKSDSEKLLLGSQIISTAVTTKTPVNIEADPKVVNLYFLIVTRDGKGVKNSNKELKDQDFSNPAAKLHGPRPPFPYQALVQKRPRSVANVYHGPRKLNEKARRPKKLCKSSSKYARSCSRHKGLKNKKS